jgi:hypothetical protein
MLPNSPRWSGLRTWEIGHRQSASRHTDLFATTRAALRALLDADLADLENHIVLTHRLVGGAPALDQNAHASAVATLREMYLEPVADYGLLM